MSVILDLPVDLEEKLTLQASQHGVSLSEYVLQLLAMRGPQQSNGQTGADLVAYWQKETLIGTRPDIADSTSHARTLRQKAETRDRG